MIENTDGDWIQTYTGRIFYPFDPKPEDIDIEDIAHALSFTCRFGGHSKQYYSVAQHCVHVSMHSSKEHALWGLLHDADETYLTDVPKPIKPGLVGFKAIQESILKAVAERFDLCWPMPAEVKAVDCLPRPVEL